MSLMKVHTKRLQNPTWALSEKFPLSRDNDVNYCAIGHCHQNFDPLKIQL